MDRHTFLRLIAARLGQLGADDAEIEKNLNLFDRYLSSLPQNERAEIIGSGESIDTLANNMYALILRQKQKAAAAAAENEGLQPGGNRQMYDINAGITQQIPAVQEQTLPAQNAPTYHPSSSVGRAYYEQHRTDTAQNNALPAPDDAPTTTMMPLQPTAQLSDAAASELKSQLHPADDYDEHYYDREEPRGSLTFWIVFLCTLPITIPLVILVILIFCCVFAALAALIFVFVAALVAVAAAGTVVSLVGIIYGVTQLVTVLPVGLYEIGLGLTALGVSMFLGILLYNLAVRLIPYLMRRTGSLMSFTLSSIADLFRYLKRRSAQTV
ncbi:MAG: hypothetical protein GX628_06540 [Clostridiales bacterium]|nr:hypothetical protein [Clostridiales bacterium]